jgi:hypothetical protein
MRGSGFESSLRTGKISEDKFQKVFIRGVLDVDLVLAHGTAEFSTLLWGIKKADLIERASRLVLARQGEFCSSIG